MLPSNFKNVSKAAQFGNPLYHNSRQSTEHDDHLKYICGTGIGQNKKQ
jgi:hypothetical protein